MAKQEISGSLARRIFLASVISFIGYVAVMFLSAVALGLVIVLFFTEKGDPNWVETIVIPALLGLLSLMTKPASWFLTGLPDGAYVFISGLFWAPIFGIAWVGLQRLRTRTW